MRVKEKATDPYTSCVHSARYIHTSLVNVKYYCIAAHVRGVFKVINRILTRPRWKRPLHSSPSLPPSCICNQIDDAFFPPTAAARKRQ